MKRIVLVFLMLIIATINAFAQQTPAEIKYQDFTVSDPDYNDSWSHGQIKAIIDRYAVSMNGPTIEKLKAKNAELEKRIKYLEAKKPEEKQTQNDSLTKAFGVLLVRLYLTANPGKDYTDTETTKRVADAKVFMENFISAPDTKENFMALDKVLPSAGTSAEIAEIKETAQNAQKEAERAHKRIDTIVIQTVSEAFKTADEDGVELKIVFKPKK